MKKCGKVSRLVLSGLFLLGMTGFSGAEAAEQRARERLGDKGGPWDRERAQTALHRALARQAAVRMMKK